MCISGRYAGGACCRGSSMAEPASSEPRWVKDLRLDLKGYEASDLLYRGFCFELLRSAGQNPAAFEGLGAERLVGAVRWAQIIKGVEHAAEKGKGAEGDQQQHSGVEG